MGLAVTPIAVAGTAGVPREQSGLASGLLNTSRTVGASLGLAVLATLAAKKTTIDVERRHCNPGAHRLGPDRRVHPRLRRGRCDCCVSPRSPAWSRFRPCGRSLGWARSPRPPCQRSRSRSSNRCSRSPEQQGGALQGIPWRTLVSWRILDLLHELEPDTAGGFDERDAPGAEGTTHDARTPQNGVTSELRVEVVDEKSADAGIPHREARRHPHRWPW